MFNTIKSLVLKEPNVLELQQRYIPEPGPREVLVKIDSAGICNSDFIVISGQFDLKYPVIPGHEFSGTVVNCGELVSNVKPGDRITSMAYSYCGICSDCRKGRHMGCTVFKVIPMDLDGGFQQMVIVSDTMIYKISERLSLEEAALAEPAACACAAVERADIYPGETVVVIGPGPIGLLTMQAALTKLPDSIIMLGTRNDRLELARKLGAAFTINTNETNAFQNIMDITNGNGVDVVHFCGGGSDAWELAGKILKPFGRVIVEAIPEPFNSKWQIPVSDFQKNINYLGVGGYSGKNFELALKLIENGVIKVDSLITHRFSLDYYNEALITAQQRKNGAVKVLIKPNL